MGMMIFTEKHYEVQCDSCKTTAYETSVILKDVGITARQNFKEYGWTFKKDGKCYCPKCSKK